MSRKGNVWKRDMAEYQDSLILLREAVVNEIVKTIKDDPRYQKIAVSLHEQLLRDHPDLEIPLLLERLAMHVKRPASSNGDLRYRVLAVLAVRPDDVSVIHEGLSYFKLQDPDCFNNVSRLIAEIRNKP